MYSTGIAYLLWLLSGFGALGFHRFYLGKVPTGLLWMFTGGLCGLGSLYDLITLPGQVREANLLHAALNRPAQHVYVHNGAAWRSVDDMEVKSVKEELPLERVILKVAKQRRGLVTPGEVALETKASLEEIKRELDKLVTRGFADLRVRKSGSLVYTFPEFMDAGEEFEI